MVSSENKIEGSDLQSGSHVKYRTRFYGRRYKLAAHTCRSITCRFHDILRAHRFEAIGLSNLMSDQMI